MTKTQQQDFQRYLILSPQQFARLRGQDALGTHLAQEAKAEFRNVARKAHPSEQDVLPFRLAQQRHLAHAMEERSTPLQIGYVDQNDAVPPDAAASAAAAGGQPEASGRKRRKREKAAKPKKVAAARQPAAKRGVQFHPRRSDKPAVAKVRTPPRPPSPSSSARVPVTPGRSPVSSRLRTTRKQATQTSPWLTSGSAHAKAKKRGRN